MSIKYFISNPTYSIIFILTIFMFFSFKSCTKDSTNPIIDDDQDGVFTKVPDPTKVITIETSSGGKMRVVGNNVLLKVDSENVDSEEVKFIIEETGGDLVGQIPVLGIYQAEYPFSTASELETMISTLNTYSEVEHATHNAVAKSRNVLHDKEYCNKDYDNHKINVNSNHNFEDMQYYLAVPLMGFVREHMTLNKVVVKVFDTDIDPNWVTKEFDDIDLGSSLNANNTAPPPPQPYAHGTQVAGVIAADNKDGGVNGIASSLINDKEKIQLWSSVIDTPVTAIQDMERITNDCVGEGALICNMSYGYGGFDEQGNLPNVEGIRLLYEVAFRVANKTLFVVAAGNDYFEITESNDAPAGIQLPNVITVAGTKYGYPDVACSRSSYGPLMDIAAPWENWPLVNPDQANQIMIDGGNSFGTPAVASLAAVLKSINPNLTPAQLKSYILDNSSSTASSISGRRLVIAQPIEQVLIDMGAPDEILDKIDITEPIGKWDLPGVVAARICKTSKIEITGEPIMECETSDTSNGGYISEITGAGVIVFSKDTQGLVVSFWNKFEILNSPLDIVEYFPGIDDAVTVGYINTNPNHFVVGNAASGTITIENGLITQRYPGTNNPMVIEAESTMSGTMGMVVAPDDINPIFVPFSGSMQITISLWEGESNEFYEYFEDNCD